MFEASLTKALANQTLPDHANKDTGMAFTLILIALSLWQKSSSYALCALVTLLLAMTWSSAYRPLAILWFGLASLLSKISSFIILSFIFYGVVLPVAMIRKVLGKDEMRKRDWKKNTNSVFIDRDHTFCADDFKAPY